MTAAPSPEAQKAAKDYFAKQGGTSETLRRFTPGHPTPAIGDFIRVMIPEIPSPDPYRLGVAPIRHMEIVYGRVTRLNFRDDGFDLTIAYQRSGKVLKDRVRDVWPAHVTDVWRHQKGPKS